MGEYIRQTDNVRITSRCYRETSYWKDEMKRTVVPTCEYLENGKCQLKACVRRGEECK